MGSAAVMTDRVYAELMRLPICDCRAELDSSIESGIYVFFEPAEEVHWRGEGVPRPVRVGINRVGGGLQERIRKHYGHPELLHGERRQSVFRCHVGGALLRQLEDIPNARDDTRSRY